MESTPDRNFLLYNALEHLYATQQCMRRAIAGCAHQHEKDFLQKQLDDLTEYAQAIDAYFGVYKERVG
jgi:hypothetical protein